MLDVAIIGGGLSGLSLAHYLQSAGINFQLFEARNRFGGRILSQTLIDHETINQKPHCLDDKSENNFRVDLGPSWIWPDHQPLIAEFIEQHNLKSFAQWNQGHSLFQTSRDQPPQLFTDPATYADSRRLACGTQILSDTLLTLLSKEQLFLSYALTQLKDQGDHIELQFKNNLGVMGAPGHTVEKIYAQRVAVMLPPRLVAQDIIFEPGLKPEMMNVMRDTPTWMASHAKAVLSYSEPFWRRKGLSGRAYSQYPGATLAEIFDVCSDDGKNAALSGFFALPVDLRKKHHDDLEALILEQMFRLFGSPAMNPLEIRILDWSEQVFTAAQQDQHSLKEHPNYGHHYFKLGHWNDKLFFGGSETAQVFGGYLEGALQSAKYVSEKYSLS